jgi:WXG100 family type VII secretion target
MMSFIKVTAGDLQSTASTVANASATIQETSQNALNAVNALTSEGWQGGGSAAAQAAIQQWQAGAAQVQDALTTIGNLITQAESSYTETDSSVASSFAS